MLKLRLQMNLTEVRPEVKDLAMASLAIIRSIDINLRGEFACIWCTDVELSFSNPLRHNQQLQLARSKRSTDLHRSLCILHSNNIIRFCPCGHHEQLLHVTICLTSESGIPYYHDTNNRNRKINYLMPELLKLYQHFNKLGQRQKRRR